MVEVERNDDAPSAGRPVAGNAAFILINRKKRGHGGGVHDALRVLVIPRNHWMVAMVKISNSVDTIYNLQLSDFRYPETTMEIVGFIGSPYIATTMKRW